MQALPCPPQEGVYMLLQRKGLQLNMPSATRDKNGRMESSNVTPSSAQWPQREIGVQVVVQMYEPMGLEVDGLCEAAMIQRPT